MCGIVGIVSNSQVKDLLYHALKGVQHRGQQAAGIATMDGNLMYIKKGIGLIKEVISEYDFSYLKGNIGIGHVRFPTAGSADDPEQAHPFYVNSPYGIMLAHNGNLTNTLKLRHEVLYQNHRHVRTKSDSEVLTNAFAFELQQATSNASLDPQAIFQAIHQLNQRLSGGYAVVSMIADFGLIGFRDPFGIRPLILGQKINADGFTSYMLASESCTLTSNGFDIIRDIAAGEAVIITTAGQLSSQICHAQPQLNMCIFEYVYLARPDSVIEGVPVQLARQRMGKYLAKTIRHNYPQLNIDVVIPVPDLARTAAIALAKELGVAYQEGFVRNHLVDNQPHLQNSEEFQLALQNRLSPIQLEFRNKNVLLVDTSIVRGSTSREIITIARNAGAKNIYFASVAPRIKYSSVYGIDMPATNGLVAHNKTDAEIATLIGADLVIFQELADLKQCIQELNPALTQFEASCFDGNYITKDIDPEYLLALANGVAQA